MVTPKVLRLPSISTIYCARVRKRKPVGKGNLVSDDVIGQRRAASIALRAHKAQSVSTVRKNRSATHGPKILTGSHQIWLHCTKIPPCCLLPFNFTSPFAQIKHCCVHNCFPHHIHVHPPFFGQ